MRIDFTAFECISQTYRIVAMPLVRRSLCLALLMSALLPAGGWGQATASTTLRVDVENAVNYLEDSADVTRLGTDTHATSPAPLKAFERLTQIADIVAVNGKPAKGTL